MNNYNAQAAPPQWQAPGQQPTGHGRSGGAPWPPSSGTPAAVTEGGTPLEGLMPAEGTGLAWTTPALAAAEAAVLLKLSGEPSQALKLALLELVVRGHIAIERHEVRHWLGFRRSKVSMVVRRPEPLGFVLRTVYDLVAAAPDTVYPCGQRGTEVIDVARMAAERWGSFGFRRTVVEPSLVRTGLLVPTPQRFLVFRWTSLEPSEEGFRVAETLRTQMREIEASLGPALAGDESAADRIAGAGPVSLLLRRRYGELEKIGRTRSSVSFGSLPDMRFDLPDFDLGFLDGIDAAFDAIGDAFDSSGGGDGCDGGDGGGCDGGD